MSNGTSRRSMRSCFPGDWDFSGAVFDQNANFSGVAFRKEIRFHDTHFRGQATFACGLLARRPTLLKPDSPDQPHSMALTLAGWAISMR